MYRLDGKIDSITLKIAERDDADKLRKEAEDKLQEDELLLISRNFQSKETQRKINSFFNNPAIIKELATIFRVIDKNLDTERQARKKGLAVHFFALLLGNLLHSHELWKKLVKIIGDPAHAETLNAFNKVLNQKFVYVRMTDVIEEYMKSVCQLGDQFLVAIDSVAEKKKRIFSSIELPHMILIIHHLLNHPKASPYVFERVFTTFDLNPAFIGFLKLSLRNLNT